MGNSNNNGTKGPGGTSHEPGKSSASGTDSNRTSPASAKTEGGNPSAGDTTQKLPRPVVVDINTGEVRPKKKNRPTGMKYNKNGDKPKGKSSEANAQTVVLVQSITQALFTVPANRLGEHWKLTDEEAQSIAIPASNLISKYFGELDEHSDVAALGIAVGSVLIGRVMMQISLPKKKEVKQDGPKQVRPSETTSPANPRKDQQPGAADGQTSTKQLLESLSIAAY